MELYQILGIIIIHYIADFIFQDEKWALGKSKNLKSLLSHTVVYSIISGILIFVLHTMYVFDLDYQMLLRQSVQYTSVAFVFHTITDYVTSKIVSRKFAANQYGSSIPNFGAFSWIGFDQVLHYVQLFITYIVIFM